MERSPKIWNSMEYLYNIGWPMRLIQGNIGRALQKYWTSRRRVQYFCKASPIFPVLTENRTSNIIIIIHAEDFSKNI